MNTINTVLKNTRFTASYSKFSALPPAEGNEIAFAGRSNAGKSSVISSVLNKKDIAKSSSRPGKTRMINLFSPPESDFITIADLPGYGYAKTSIKEIKKWERELTLYITGRENLKGVVIVADARRGLTDHDRSMLVLCRTGGRKVHVLLNKTDKIKKNDRKTVYDKVTEELALIAPGASCSLYSALKGSGKDELFRVVTQWLGL